MAEFFKLILSHLPLFLLAVTPHVKDVGAAADCSGACSPFEMPPCRSTDCRCIPWALFGGHCIYPTSGGGVIKQMVDEHHNLCQSHADCFNKGSGTFCAHYPNPDIDYGWCFASESQAKDIFKIASHSEFAKSFVKIISNSGLANNFLKMPALIEHVLS